MIVNTSSIWAVALVSSYTLAFSPSSIHNMKKMSLPRSVTQLNVVSDDNNQVLKNRRSILSIISTSTFATLSISSANASLLDEFGSDPNKIQDMKSDVDTSRGPVVAKPKSESTIEPNLRSNYYYPTNKKRYLPRIKRCNDAIPLAADAIGNLDWEAISDFNDKIADDTILPMKLYTSSLTGGGTNVKVSFTKEMNKAADDFEKAQKALSKAIKKQDQSASSKALEEMATALLAYRTSGRLLGPDGGGDIPSVDEIRRSACRVQGRTFEQKIKARDERVASAGTKE